MTASPATFRDVFAVREFRWLWVAHVLSVAGDQLARVALVVLVYDRTASAGLAAWTYALTYLPDLLGGAALGHLADRFPRRTVMVVTDVGRAALVALMAVPAIPLGAQVGLLLAVGVLAAPFQAARTAVMPRILASDRLTLGFGVMQSTYQLGLVAGFGAGAAVVAQLGAHGALMVDAATFMISAGLIRFGLHPHHVPATLAADRLGHWSTVAQGWSLVTRDARLRSLLALACCSGFYVIPEGLAVPYSAQIGAGTAGAGWLWVANPVGAVLGMLMLRVVAPQRRVAWLGWLAVATSLVLLPTGWAASLAPGPALAMTVLLWGLSGLLSAHNMITQAEYIRAVPDGKRGQAGGIATAALRAAQGVGIGGAGLAAQMSADPADIIVMAAAVGVLFAAAGWAAWSRAASSQPASERDEADDTDITSSGSGTP
jgi:MFS family permease